MKSWKNGGACETKPPAWRLAANCRGKLGFSSFSRPPLSQTAPIKTRTHTMPFMYRTPLTGWRVSQSYTHPGTHGVEGWISHLSSLPFSVSRTRRIKLERAAARRIALRPLYLGRPGVEPEPEILRISGGPPSDEEEALEKISRERFIRLGTALGVGAAAASLAACGGGAASNSGGGSGGGKSGGGGSGGGDYGGAGSGSGSQASAGGNAKAG